MSSLFMNTMPLLTLDNDMGDAGKTYYLMSSLFMNTMQLLTLTNPINRT